MTISAVPGVFITVGLVFDLLGCIGLARLPDVYNRAQAATKCVTLGTCLILIGVFAQFGVSALGIKALLCMLFVLFTSPVGAHAVVRGAYRAGVRLWEGSVVDAYADVAKRDEENR